MPLFSYSYGTVFGNSVAQIRSFSKELLVILMETLWLIFGRCVLLVGVFKKAGDRKSYRAHGGSISSDMHTHKPIPDNPRP